VPTGGVQRLVTLPPAPESARQARRFVTEVVTAARADAYLETAALLTSELVTNGIVHAHTDLQVVVEATQTWVRVEVIDGNPMLPVRKTYNEDALTGRGMEMVELLATDFGVMPLADEGKRVWFRLGQAPLIDDDGNYVRDAEPRGSQLMTVQLLNLPVVLYCAWQQHADAMLREATLAAFEALESGTKFGALPEDFALANDALASLASTTNDIFGFLDSGVSHVDIDVRIPRDAAPSFPVLRDVLRTCSGMSMAGELLVPPSLPEIQAVRHWVCDEVNRQMAGLEPHAWLDPLGDDLPMDPVSADAIDEVRRSAVAQIAADRGNRILAVSDSAAELLGWNPPSELEGHRLVAIIPGRLRDAHVAAFTNQLLGGGDRIIGKPTRLPAMRRDGSEITIELLVERRRDSRNRSFLVATLTAN
jgi:PAS domain S-box-containing protein